MPAPALFSLTYAAFQASNTLLASFMLVSPSSYHTYILRPCLPSTTDLYSETQFTDLTKHHLLAQIRSTGISLLSTSLYLFFSPGSKSYISYRAIFFSSLGVVASHSLLLYPIFKEQRMRQSWLDDRERVWKVMGLVGINVLVAVLAGWASLGTWPWPAWETAPGINVFDAKVGGLVEGFVKGIEDMAGGVLRNSVMGG